MKIYPYKNIYIYTYLPGNSNGIDILRLIGERYMKKYFLVITILLLCTFISIKLFPIFKDKLSINKKESISLFKNSKKKIANWINR